MTERLSQEWLLLQKQHETYEFVALAIKAGAVALFAANVGLLPPLLVLLWLQEGIVKTFQARLAARLLRVEQAMREPSGGVTAMQLHSEWAAHRPGGLDLLREYALSACRPTVAFAYPILILLDLMF